MVSLDSGLLFLRHPVL